MKAVRWPLGLPFPALLQQLQPLLLPLPSQQLAR
jgi:hypothetical protein